MSTGTRASTQAAPAPTAAAPADGRRRRPHVRELVQGQGLLLMLVALVVVFATQSEFFLSWDNFLAIGGGAAALGIMAVAQTYVIVSGGFDVSVGSVVALCGVIIGVLTQDGMGIWLAVAIAMLAAAGVGMLNGFIVVVLGINPLITTLGTMSVFAGLAFTLLPDGQTAPIDDSAFAFLGTGYVGSIPFPLILFLAIVLIALVIERRTPVGRAIYAIGGNPEAARLSGLRSKLIPFMLYVLSGLSAGLAGVMIASQLTAASPEVGGEFLLGVATAVILGGASLKGGRGTVLGTLIAVLILGTLQNGFSLLGLPSYVQTMALGIALLIAVLLQEATRLVERK